MASKKSGDGKDNSVPLLEASCRENEPSSYAVTAGANYRLLSCRHETVRNGDVHQLSVDEPSSTELLHHYSLFMDNAGIVSLAFPLQSNANNHQPVLDIQDSVTDQQSTGSGFPLNGIDAVSMVHSEHDSLDIEHVEHAVKAVNGKDRHHHSGLCNHGDNEVQLETCATPRSNSLESPVFEFVGAVGGYVNGYSTTREYVSSELSEPTQDTYSTNTAEAYHFAVCDRVSNNESNLRDTLDSSELYKVANHNFHRSVPHSALESVTCGAEASGFTNLGASCGDAASDFCLDDYIDADMHLSPVAGSLSMSSSSLSDDEDLAVTEQDCNRELKTYCNTVMKDNNCLHSSVEDCQNVFPEQLNLGRLTNNSVLSPNGSSVDFSHTSRERVYVAQMLQSSGHPSSSSFDSLPASLPSPCGNFTDNGEASSVLHEQFCFADTQLVSGLHVGDCLFNSEKTVENNGCMQHQKMVESHWLSMSGNSELDSFGLECKACSNVTNYRRPESSSHLFDEVESNVPMDSSHNATGGFLRADLNDSLAEHSLMDEQALMNESSMSSDYIRCMGGASSNISNNGIMQPCKKCWKCHTSSGTAISSHSSVSCGTTTDSIALNGDHLHDRNLNHFCDFNGGCATGQLAVRLSTSLTLLVHVVLCLLGLLLLC
jgi:hypothetical protein